MCNDQKAIKYAGWPSVLTSGGEGRPECRVDVEGEPEEERDDRHEDDELRYGPASDQVQQVRGVEEVLDWLDRHVRQASHLKGGV